MSADRPWIKPTVPPPPALGPPAPRGKPVLRKDHPVATAFLDETGAISKDRIFGIGLLKLNHPSRFLRAIQKLRDETHWYNEIKYYDVTKGSLWFYKRVVDVCAAATDLEFFSFVADRETSDPVARFGTHWDAYGKLAEQLVVASFHPDELVALMADNYSTPDSVLFEEDLRAAVNRRLNRLALISAVRLDSRASDGLQVVDLLTSSVAHEFRVATGLASTGNAKAEIAAYVRSMLGTPSCLGGWRNGRHSIQVYGH